MAQRRGGRVVLAGAGLLGLVALLLVIGVALRRGGLDVAADVAQLLTVPLTVGSLVAALLHYAARRPAPDPAAGRDRRTRDRPDRDRQGRDERPGVFVCPRLEAGEAVDRPPLLDALVAAVTTAASGPDTAGAGVTGATGGGGFGKTTLAKALVHDPRVWRRFADGVVWTALGERADAAAVAAQANDLTTALTGARPALNDPVAAGAELAGAVGGRDVLLVVDDVWHETQLRPFLQVLDRARPAGSGPAVLVTTRRRSVLPLDTPTVGVDAMADDEAERLLTRGLPAGAPDAVAAVLRLTGRWPVLLAMANGTVRRDVARGADADAALAALAADLGASGPDLLGLESASGRDRAVTATLRASLHRLTGTERRRYASLAVFADDVEIPAAVLTAYWDRLDDDPDDPREPVPDVLRGLDDLGLLAEYRLDEPYPRLRLHDVLRDWLRHEHADRLPDLHAALLDAHAGLVPRVDGDPAWWRLPAGADGITRYLGDHLAEHLAGAGRHDELAALLLRPDWILARLDAAGPAGLEHDLGSGRSPAVAVLTRVVRQDGHLLGPLAPAGSVAATLASRLAHEPELAGLHRALVATVDGAYLDPVTPLPDLPPRALLRVLDHPGATLLTVDPRGRWLATARAARHPGVQIWDPRTGALLHELDHDVGAVVAAPDGSWLAIPASGGVRVWDTGTGAVRHLLDDDAERLPYRPLAVAPDGHWLATGSALRDGVRIWDPDSGVLLRTLDLLRVGALAVSAGGLLAGVSDLSAETDGLIRVWDPDTGQSLRSFHHPGADLLAVAPDGSWLASTSRLGGDGALLIWDVASGATRHVIVRHPEVRSLHALPGAGLLVEDGSFLDGTGVRLESWDPETGTRRWASGRPVRAVAATADGRLLAVARDRPGDVVVCEASTGHVLQTLDRLDAGVLAIAPDGSWLASGTFWPTTSRVQVWNTASGGPGATVYPEAGPLTVPSGGTWFATAEGRTVRIRDSRSGRELRALDQEGVDALVSTPDGRLLAGRVPGPDPRVRVWEVDSGALVHDVEGSGTGVALSADGSRLAVLDPFPAGGSPSRVTVHDLTGRRALPTVLHPDASAFALGPDGSWLVTADVFHTEYPLGTTVRIWDTDTGALRHELEHSRAATMALSADGHRLVTSSYVRADEPEIRVWDPGTGTLLHVVPHEGTTALAVAPGGEWLVDAGHSHGGLRPPSIRVWDLMTGTLTRTFTGADAEALTIAPDGSWFAAVGGEPDGEGTVRVWDTGTWEPLAALRTGQRIHEVVPAAGLLGLRSAQGNGLLRLRSRAT